MVTQKSWIDPILEEWAENNLLCYGLVLVILTLFKMLFQLVTIGMHVFFRDLLKTRTRIPDSVIVFRGFTDTFIIFVNGLFATMSAVIPVTSFYTLGLFIVMSPLQAIAQIWVCMSWLLVDKRRNRYTLIETSIDLPIGVFQILALSVAIPLFYREVLIFVDINDV